MGLLDFIPFLGGSSSKPNQQNTGGQITAAGSPVSAREQAILARERDIVARFAKGLIDVKDIIAPSAIEVNFNNLIIGHKYFRSYFAVKYPSVVSPNWLEPLINFEYPVDISTFYYPRDTSEILKILKRKIAEMQATLNLQTQSGKPADPITKVQLEDALQFQSSLADGSEKYFQYALYITIHAESLEELEQIAKNLESTMAAIGVIIKVATLQQEECFQSCIPYGQDKIQQLYNFDTTAIAMTFPFVSSELTQERGVLYGVNLHNSSLVIFDRFSLPNANSVVLATSGAGKSYTVKLEAVRSLMMGVDIIIIDPEKEFDRLCEAVGGEYISFSQDGAQKLNPFELSGLGSEEEDELRFKILTVTGLIRMMMGGSLTAEEAAILDRAVILAYKEKGITPDPATHANEAPLLEDLYKILNAMAEDEAHSMARRLEKYIKGSAAGVFDRRSTVDVHNTFTVFSIRDLTSELRPLAMYTMLDYIWNKVKRDRRKRLLIIDEAWLMMQYEDAARFVYSVAKRARKYALGLTTITQDVDDFLNSDYGKAIINNSSMQMLLKQSPAAVDKLKKVFYLTDGEKQFLLSAGIGQGLFFAGANHVAIQVVASQNEHNLITTNPNELLSEDRGGDV
ncbi:MAG: ATP-binding protein [Candidatus Dojkabacteria bacterium]|nr:ATP-binding protein [Candidatus Dojkabacteria bacterium]MDQ7021604.1 ATP-binding protein [Candidatus Dojkabacteria bacterium]